MANFIPSVLAALAVSFMLTGVTMAEPTNQLTDPERQRFQKTEFLMVKTIKALPHSVREQLNIKDSLPDTKEEFPSMADPGQPFSAGCTVTPGTSLRRLILAATAADRCFVLFEQGAF